MMRLQAPPRIYDAASESRRNQIIEAADAQNHKRGQDVEIQNARLILKSPDGTRFEVTVTDLGMVIATAL